MIRSVVLGENPYTVLTDKQFLKEFDAYMTTPYSYQCSLSVYACFDIRFLVEFNRRFRPKEV